MNAAAALVGKTKWRKHNINKNYRILNQNYPKFQGVFLRQFTSIKSTIILISPYGSNDLLIRFTHSAVRQFKDNFCLCSNEMQLRRIWRAKQNEGNIWRLRRSLEDACNASYSLKFKV